MVFSSLEFIYFYLPSVFLIYFLIPPRYLALRNFFLLIVSLIFYAWSEPAYIWIMFLSIAIDYTCGKFVAKYKRTSPKKAKLALIISIVLNLSILGFFKYADFFIQNLKFIPFLKNLEPIGISLPVGISFYTFQTMSYTIDVYFEAAEVQTNIATFGTYVTMFPQLIAGPIVRYRDVDKALRYRNHTLLDISKGIERFICGLAKKVLLANSAGAFYENFVSGVNTSPNILCAWLGIIFFAFQIYFDFSGYSDMAIGLGYILGFKFPENFNYPYISKSISEFWRRWHITLSTWFREYVYIPLGGNRKGNIRTFLNLIIVWFLTGLWHGASWNFVLWGLYFALIIILEKLFLGKLLSKLPEFISHIYSLFFILLGWFIFIYGDLKDPVGYFFALFKSPVFLTESFYDIFRALPFLILLAIIATPLPHEIYLKLVQKNAFRVVMCICQPIILLLCTAYLVDSSYNPFLYFRF